MPRPRGKTEVGQQVQPVLIDSAALAQWQRLRDGDDCSIFDVPCMIALATALDYAAFVEWLADLDVAEYALFCLHQKYIVSDQLPAVPAGASLYSVQGFLVVNDNLLGQYSTAVHTILHATSADDAAQQVMLTALEIIKDADPHGNEITLRWQNILPQIDEVTVWDGEKALSYSAWLKANS